MRIHNAGQPSFVIMACEHALMGLAILRFCWGERQDTAGSRRQVPCCGGADQTAADDDNFMHGDPAENVCHDKLAGAAILST